MRRGFLLLLLPLYDLALDTLWELTYGLADSAFKLEFLLFKNSLFTLLGFQGLLKFSSGLV